MGYRELSFSREVEGTYEEFLEALREGFDGDVEESRRTCRELLASIYFPGPKGYDQLLADPGLPVASRAALLQMDPDNITLEHEYYTDVEPERYARIKPMVWFWIMFDRSVMGHNCGLGFAVRQILAERVFARCGKNLRCFHDVEFTWGYNIECADDVTIHRGVMLDDRGGLKIGNKVSISDWANVYTHTHSVEDIGDVTCMETVLEEGVRLTYHSTVLAGASVGKNGMVGACALATKSVPENWVWGGIPAKPLKEKTSRLGEEASACC